MDFFYLSKKPQPTGEYEIHKPNCTFLPPEKDRIYLGTFRFGSEAMKEAKKHYEKIDGCYYCLHECHKKGY